MGYGVAMPTRSYRHMSAEERETLSLGLARGHSLRTMATVLGRAPRHREPRVGPQPHAGPPLSGLYGAGPSGRSSSSAPATTETPRPRAVAVLCGRIWLKAARPNRLPDASDARILST